MTMKTSSRRVKLILFLRETRKDVMTAYLVKRPVSHNRKWPGVLFDTLGCKVGVGENDLTVLGSLLSELFSNQTKTILSPFELFGILMKQGLETIVLYKGDHVTTYGLLIPRECLKLIEPRDNRFSFTKITARDLIHLVVATEQNKHQPPDGNVPIVFKHTKLALETAFRRLWP